MKQSDRTRPSWQATAVIVVAMVAIPASGCLVKKTALDEFLIPPLPFSFEATYTLDGTSQSSIVFQSRNDTALTPWGALGPARRIRIETPAGGPLGLEGLPNYSEFYVSPCGEAWGRADSSDDGAYVALVMDMVDRLTPPFFLDSGFKFRQAREVSEQIAEAPLNLREVAVDLLHSTAVGDYRIYSGYAGDGRVYSIALPDEDTVRRTYPRWTWTASYDNEIPVPSFFSFQSGSGFPQNFTRTNYAQTDANYLECEELGAPPKEERTVVGTRATETDPPFPFSLTAAIRKAESDPTLTRLHEFLTAYPNAFVAKWSFTGATPSMAPPAPTGADRWRLEFRANGTSDRVAVTCRLAEAIRGLDLDEQASYCETEADTGPDTPAFPALGHASLSDYQRWFDLLTSRGSPAATEGDFELHPDGQATGAIGSWEIRETPNGFQAVHHQLRYDAANGRLVEFARPSESS